MVRIYLCIFFIASSLASAKLPSFVCSGGTFEDLTTKNKISVAWINFEWSEVRKAYLLSYGFPPYRKVYYPLGEFKKLDFQSSDGPIFTTASTLYSTSNGKVERTYELSIATQLATAHSLRLVYRYSVPETKTEREMVFEFPRENCQWSLGAAKSP